MKYSIVAYVGNDAYKKVVNEVNDLLQKGWFLQGGVSTIIDYANHSVGFAQAVVKNEVPEELPGKTLNLDTK